MKLALFDDNRVGVVKGDMIYDVSAIVPGWNDPWPPVFMVRLMAEWNDRMHDIEAAADKAAPIALADVKLRSPVPYCSNIIAAPANYLKHVGELGDRGVAKVGQSVANLGFFLKATSSMVGASETIRLPRGSNRRFDHESELAVIIGKGGKDITRDQALDHVFGYSCLIDVSMRLEPGAAKEERPTRKSFDSFTPIGPWIVTADELPDPSNLTNRLWVNDEIRHDGNTKDLIVDVPGLIELSSSVMTLQPGDIIATGTPEGVGPIKPGDRVKIELGGIGSMELPVVLTQRESPKIF